MNRRWDGDVRGGGIASGAPFAAGVDDLREHMRDPGWVTEEAAAHLLPHIRRAAEATRRLRVLGDHQDADDGVYCVRLAWQGDGGIGSVREDVFRVIGSFAEASTHVRQRRLEGAVEYDVVTGMLPDETHFRTHGHLVRLRVEGAPGATAAG